MKAMQSIQLRRIIFLFVLALSISFSTYAQGPGGDGDLGNPDNVPIDGGLSLALAAGAGYLVKRRHDAKKKKAEQDKEMLP
ncbi:MAG TPA: hypothetical protein VF622_01535 [Segetibacter sp.]|jgi:hypothetical protein